MSALKLQFVLEAIDHATKNVRAVQERIDRLTSPVANLAKGFANVREKMAALAKESGIDKVSAAWGNLTERVGKLPFIAAISLAGVVAAVAMAEQKLGALVRQSINLGIPTAEFQKLSYAASMAGVGPEELAHGMQHLTNTMNEARTGSKEALAMFKVVGLPLAALRKMKTEDVLMAIADKFNRVGDSGHNAETKMTVLRALMSRAGPELKGFFDQGSSGIRSFGGELEKMGGTLSDADAQGVKKFGQGMTRLSATFDAMMARIVTRVNPALTKMIDLLSAKNQANGEAIVDVVSRALTALVTEMPKVLAALGGVSKGVVQLFTVLDTVANALGGWQTLFAVFATVVGGKLVMAVWALAEAFWGLGVALMTTPIGWAILGFAALVAAGVWVYKNWDTLKATWKGLWDEAKGIFDGFWNWLKPKLDWVSNGIAGMLGPSSLLGRMVDGLPAALRLPDVDASGRVTRPGAVLASPVGRVPQLGGTLKIEVEDNRLKVADLRKAPGSWLNLDVNTGQAMFAY